MKREIPNQNSCLHSITLFLSDRGEIWLTLSSTVRQGKALSNHSPYLLPSCVDGKSVIGQIYWRPILASKQFGLEIIALNVEFQTK